ncbi:16S rRNA (guanine(527)-N(7))-methyltransferase RsmG [Salibacterium salarium]|uniref:Ribosomal RNA small subunit methyltransferase G n=1 Tax=Salibacterium salarium TaxID=284579 RepID=A0A428MU01_9BACI|nr:16S rRNA (guanine(527)-N(7))-methyltransferase RsmG [Salibacterium salarium]RSL29614.1 16S rRNA (guanine(527)-N(7))-methyltransferase RsmG [Salibacterium salarium]
MRDRPFESWLYKKGIHLSERQSNQFDLYYRILVDWNKKVNLTSLTDRDDVYEKHFYDSLSAAFFHDFQNDSFVIDIGAGAGFPSLPIKICYPHLHIVIVDSLKKRITFLESLVEELELDNVSFVHSRAEDMAHDPSHREQYDVVMARAVAKMPVLTELCLPFVKTGGAFLALKGSNGMNEKQEAGKACRILGGRWLDAHALTLPNEESERFILEMEKIDASPRTYPRKAGTPSKNPLL